VSENKPHCDVHMVFCMYIVLNLVFISLDMFYVYRE